MEIIIGSSLFLALIIVRANEGTNFFLVSPGDGKEFVYSPVDVNATLHCAVNNINLGWVIDSSLFLNNEVHRPVLDSRGIFQNETLISSNGMRSSSITVLGNREMNNGTRVCCQTILNTVLKENCTALIIYGKPSSPTNVSVQISEDDALINISWTATTMTGVNQNYTIVFDKYTLETTQLHYIYQQNTSDIKCSAYIIAVNGAGESDPSNNVSIPSLPDIGPVIASLSHQVWKYNGEIKVNISFQPAGYCWNYPVLSYLVVLRSKQAHTSINISLDANETEIILHPQDGLEDNQKYMYKLNASNSVGVTTTDERILFTSDVQSVNATVVGESTIDIQCWFIRGSDAMGCKVVLVSEHPGVNNEIMNITRNNMSAFGTLNLTQPASCYSKVFAFDIQAKHTLSNLTIKGKVYLRSTPNVLCSVIGLNHSPSALPTTLVTVVLIIAVIIIAIIIFLIILMRHKQGIYCWNLRSWDICTSNDKRDPKRLMKKSPTSTDSNNGVPQSSHSESTPTPTQTDVPPVLTGSGSGGKETVSKSTSSPSVPLYAVPDKLRQKEKSELSSSSKEMEPNDQHGFHHEEHLYHVLENNRAPCSADVIPPDPYAPELPPPLEPDSQDDNKPPVYQDITELSSKADKLANYERSEQQCQHGEHDFDTESDTVTLTKPREEKV